MKRFCREFLTGFLISVVFGGALTVMLWRPAAPPVEAEEDDEVGQSSGLGAEQ